MTGDERSIMREAANWHVASANDDMDWAGLTVWLQADQAHRAAYDEIAMADAVLAEHRLDIFPAGNDFGVENDRPIRQAKHWWRWGSAALAASFALAVAIPMLGQSNTIVYQTAMSGQEVTLPDGSSVTLAPNSRLELDGGDMEMASLTGGGLFDIRHDPDRTLRIQAGGMEISDIGTRFDVQAGQSGVRIAVAQGRLSVASAALPTSIELAAGQSLSYDRLAGRASVARTETADVGSWRQGRLSYQSVPLALVAQDLSLYAHVDIEVDRAIGQRPFSGTLVLSNGDAAVQDLSQLMDLRLHRDRGAYRLGPAER